MGQFSFERKQRMACYPPSDQMCARISIFLIASRASHATSQKNTIPAVAKARMISLAAVSSRIAASAARPLLAPGAQRTGWHPGTDTMGKDILALICPDWQRPMVAVETSTGYVAYANWRALEMFKHGAPARLVHGRLALASGELNTSFYASLARTVTVGTEYSVIIGRGGPGEPWTSMTIRNGLGFFRDTLQRHLVKNGPIAELVTVEFGGSGARPEPIGLRAFAEAAGLARAETTLIEAIACGKSLKEIAAESGLSLATVRQRMKAVLAKTNCCRQVELMRLILSLCPWNYRVEAAGSP
jgi:DNA-binding CsgD family transcriptional regulator